MRKIVELNRKSAFSFKCTACGFCCHNKKIQLNPYEIARMADYLGKSSTEFLRDYVEKNSPFLRFTDSDRCVFLDQGACKVHPARPLVCRLYPLGQHITGEGTESFSCAVLPEECNGILGSDCCMVADFLDSQETSHFMEASNRYLNLFYRLYKLIYNRLDDCDIPNASSPSAITPEFFSIWFDVDKSIAPYINENNIPVPTDLVEPTAMHIEVLENEFGLIEEESHEDQKTNS